MSDQFYLYAFETAERRYTYCAPSHPMLYDGETYAPVAISHRPPVVSSEPSQGRVAVMMRDDLEVALNFISHPPPYTTHLTIWEVLATTISGNSLLVTHVEPHWFGQVMRVAWRDSFRAVEMTCRTKQDVHFSRETLNEGLGVLCRFHIGDGRCPVNIEDFKETVAVVDVGDDVSEPTLEVSGLAQTDDYYAGGMVRLGDGDMRTVLQAASGVLTLSRAFPSTFVQPTDTVEVFAGDDLTFETCAVRFGSQTDSGAAWGGWKLTPNRDYQRFGIRAPKS